MGFFHSLEALFGKANIKSAEATTAQAVDVAVIQPVEAGQSIHLKAALQTEAGTLKADTEALVKDVLNAAIEKVPMLPEDAKQALANAASSEFDHLFEAELGKYLAI